MLGYRSESAEEIIENLENALEQFRAIQETLEEE